MGEGDPPRVRNPLRAPSGHRARDGGGRRTHTHHPSPPRSPPFPTMPRASQLPTHPHTPPSAMLSPTSHPPCWGSPSDAVIPRAARGPLSHPDPDPDPDPGPDTQTPAPTQRSWPPPGLPPHLGVAQLRRGGRAGPDQSACARVCSWGRARGLPMCWALKACPADVKCRPRLK